MPSRDGALTRAARFFDEGGFRSLLARLVEHPSTSQEPGAEAALETYLTEGIRPWLERMGFAAAIHENPLPGFGPILTAERIEDASRPTILLYGHR
jgi:acetylornithine deacetylase/succinyl-diaminopimelate desuccinylase-like protein